MHNLLLKTDSYKSSHACGGYPSGMSNMFSYLESRGGKYDKTLFFGLQYILKEYLSHPFCGGDIAEAEEFFAAHGEPFPSAGFRHINEKHGGFIPIRIRAVPEGSLVPNHNVLMTAESTDPEVPWVVNYFETLLMQIWYPVTVCTQSYFIKQDILKALHETADNPEAEIAFKLHDFGYRGVSSQESAGIGGAAHLVNFMGSDTVAGVYLANKYYYSKMAGFSIPACYDGKTEILTENGFVPFPLLKKDTKVAQYSESGHIEFVLPSEVHEAPYTGPMVQFYTDGNVGAIDLLVTPNHRMVRRSISTNKVEIVPAESATFSQKNKIIQSGIKHGNIDQFTSLDALRFAFQADGSFVNRSDEYTGKITGCKPIRFTLKKERKKERLRELLRELNYEWTECDSNSRGGYTLFWVKIPLAITMSKELDWVNIANISTTWCNAALREIAKWDGQTKFDTIMFHSSNHKAADIIHAIGILSGHRSSITSYDDPRGNRKTQYTVLTPMSTDSRSGQGVRKTFVDYDGNVYCVTVPSGMIIVRRNGYVCICGNSEHSTITSWGRDHEVDAYRNMLTKFAKPGGLVAVVSDSYDLMHACKDIWGRSLRDEVVKSGATVVIRPDSGNPPEIVSQTLMALDEAFGSVVNSKGFKVLKNVRVIQGDGINQDSIREILTMAKFHGFSASNIAFGMGGALLQQINRDTQKFAYKCSSVTVDGVERDVFKDPATDHSKKSKAGRLDLVKYLSGQYATLPLLYGNVQFSNSELVTVFENGKLLKQYTLDEIRARSAQG